MAKENEKKTEKLNAKRDAALAKKEELAKEIEELRLQILDEKDEKKKAELREKKDELTAVRNGIVIEDDKVVVPMPKKKKKIIQAVIAVVVVIALIFTYVATGMAKHGFVSTLGYPQRAFTGLVLTEANGKKHGIKASTYNYYYANYYNNLKQQQSYMSQYGSLLGGAGGSDEDSIDFDKEFSKQTTKDEDGKEVNLAKYTRDQIIKSIKETYALYYAAVEANNGKEPEIKEDQQKEIDETLDQIKTYADQAKYTLDAYIPLVMGYGVNSEVVQKESKIQYIAQNYSENYTFGEEEYNDYLKTHEDELKGVDVKYAEVTSEDEAKKFIDELKDDGSNFEELVAKYGSNDWEKKRAKDEPNEVTYYNLTRANLQSMGGAIGVADEHNHEEGEEEHAEEEEHDHEHTYKGLDWLFSADRKAGDKYYQSTSVVYVLKPAYLYEGKTLNVRHILIQPEGEAEEGKDGEEAEPATVNASEADKKQLAAAQKKAEEVLAEYNKGEKTAEAFGDLAKKYSSDGNASTGGRYENIYTNQMVSTFNNWCFDANRKAGDVSIVLTEFGYHIIYFEGEGDSLNWHAVADSALKADDSESSLNKVTDKSKIKTSFFGSRYFQTDLDMNT